MISDEMLDLLLINAVTETCFNAQGCRVCGVNIYKMKYLQNEMRRKLLLKSCSSAFYYSYIHVVYLGNHSLLISGPVCICVLW